MTAAESLLYRSSTSTEASAASSSSDGKDAGGSSNTIGLADMEDSCGAVRCATRDARHELIPQPRELGRWRELGHNMYDMTQLRSRPHAARLGPARHRPPGSPRRPRSARSGRTWGEGGGPDCTPATASSPLTSTGEGLSLPLSPVFSCLWLCGSNHDRAARRSQPRQTRRPVMRGALELTWRSGPPAEDVAAAAQGGVEVEVAVSEVVAMNRAGTGAAGPLLSGNVGKWRSRLTWQHGRGKGNGRRQCPSRKVLVFRRLAAAVGRGSSQQGKGGNATALWENMSVVSFRIRSCAPFYRMPAKEAGFRLD